MWAPAHAAAVPCRAREAQPKIPGSSGRGALAAVSRRSSVRPRGGGLHLLALAIPSARASPPPDPRYFRQQAISMASFVGHALFSRAWCDPRLRGLRQRGLRAAPSCAAGVARGVADRPGGSFRRRLMPAHTASARHPGSLRRRGARRSPTPAAPRPAPRLGGSGRRCTAKISYGVIENILWSDTMCFQYVITSRSSVSPGPCRTRPTARLRLRSEAEPSERDCEARPRGRKNRSRSRGEQRGGRARPPAPRGLRAAPRSGTASHETPPHATTAHGAPTATARRRRRSRRPTGRASRRAARGRSCRPSGHRARRRA